ncbi:MAG: DUF4190 domain-containing protein [Flavobacteriia bacterium]|nr:DUF4190 domain-containing protein [Flavobacteriia bacterium]
MEDQLGLNEKLQSKSLPNAIAVLVLGIVSLVGYVFWGVLGLICGIVAIILHKKDKLIYEFNPDVFENSFKSSRAGYICGIVGVSLSFLMIIFGVFYFYFIYSLITKFPH